MLDARGNQYCYLNVTAQGESTLQGAPMVSKLAQFFKVTKQAKAPPSQWVGVIRGLTQKGIKQTEIDESSIIPRLYAEQDAGTKNVTAEEVLAMVNRGIPTIKETILQKSMYDAYRTRKGAGTYTEALYSLNSARDDVNDELEELSRMIEELQFDAGGMAFDMTTLMDDPELPQRMANRVTELKALLPKAWDFPASHFSAALRDTGIRNILAWSRTTICHGVMLIDEIQSDWAQQGRRQDWKTIPRAPFVVSTESWSGLVLRRTMQRAALNSAVTQVNWITADMRNGWWQNGRAATIAEDGPATPATGMDKFYLEMLPKIADKVLKPLGGKTAFLNFTMPDGSVRKLPGFVMTPQVRAGLLQSLPLYSLSPVWERDTRTADHPAVQATLNEVSRMLGSSSHVRLARYLYDASSHHYAAGHYANRVIDLSLRAKDLDRTAAHEVWHFAEDQLLRTGERQAVHDAFRRHTLLARRTMATLAALGEVSAVRQCLVSPAECAAHAFSLYKTGALEMPPSPVKSLFQRIVHAVQDLGHWVCERTGLVTPAELGGYGSPAAQRHADHEAQRLFEALRSGALAQSARRRSPGATESRTPAEYSLPEQVRRAAVAYPVDATYEQAFGAGAKSHAQALPQEAPAI